MEFMQYLIEKNQSYIEELIQELMRHTGGNPTDAFVAAATASVILAKSVGMPEGDMSNTISLLYDSLQVTVTKIPGSGIKPAKNEASEE